MSQDFTTELEQRLHLLAEEAAPPPVATSDDVARGRRGLARRRTAAGAAVLATAAVVTVAALGLGGDSDTAGPGPAGPGPSTTATDPAPPSPSPTPTGAPPDRRSGKQLLTAWARALGSHLDPDGGHLQRKPDNLQGGAGLGTKLGWRVEGESGLGMVQVYVGRDAFSGSYTGLTCGSGPACETVTVGGVEMRIQRVDGTTSVYHVQPDGDRVFLYLDPLFGNNSLTPLASLDFPLRVLAAAVSDPAFTTPTPRQVNGASASFGFPELG